jgi:DNA-binding winged helix-turn-helix (wHTH) protein
MNEGGISFGPFSLFAEQRLLLEGDRPVRLGSRAFDILVVLVERAGEVVGKEQLIARAWPQTHVEEANLKIQLSALRSALGDGHGAHRCHSVAKLALTRFRYPVRPGHTGNRTSREIPLASSIHAGSASISA